MKKIIVATLISLFTLAQTNIALGQGVAKNSNNIVPVAPAPAPAEEVAPKQVAAPTPAPAPSVTVTTTVSTPNNATQVSTSQVATKPAAPVKYKIAAGKTAENKIAHKPILTKNDFVDKNHFEKNSKEQITKLNFSEVAKVEVEPDYYNAVLHFEISGEGEFTKMQNDLNEAMQRALAIAMEYPQLKIETKDYNVARDYSTATNQDIRWTASQKIILDSKNKTQLLNAVARIQSENFALDSLTSYLSDAKKAEYKDQLIENALMVVKSRAMVVAKSLDKKTVKFAEIRIDSDNFFPFHYDMRAGMAKTMSAATTPTLESPAKTISLTLTVEALLM